MSFWIDFELLALVGFFLFVLIVIINQRKNVEFKYGIVLLKYKRVCKKIESFIEKNKKILTVFGYLSIAISLSLGVFGFFYILSCAIFSQACFAIVLPTAAGYQIPGPVVSVPLLMWLTILPVLLIPHEFSHALYSLYSKIKIKSYGLVFLFLLPIGAFVDPDMKRFKKLELKKKLFILSIGSFSNFLTFLLLLLLLYLLNSIVVVKIDYDVIEGSPAFKVNLSGAIERVNNIRINNLIELIKILNQTKPNQTIIVETENGVFEVKLSEHENIRGRGFLGITNITQKLEYDFFGFRFPVGWEVKYLIFLATISLGVAMVNMLPLKPLDGGLVLEEILKKLLGSEKAKQLISYISLFVVGILLYNLYLTTKFGFPFKFF